MKEDPTYQKRLKHAPDFARGAVRIVFALVLLMLALGAAYAALHSQARGRAEDAYYHIAEQLASGKTPQYDAQADGLPAVTDPAALGLTASARWRDCVTVDAEGGVRAISQLCLPVWNGLNIEIQCEFPK